MRTRRIKISAKEGEEVFRKQLWATAEYCGVEVLTWTILTNHFHVLVRVPLEAPVSDEELLRRYEVLHPKPSKYNALRLEVMKGYLAENNPTGQRWRQAQLAQMGDVSQFIKLLKQRYSIWFNKRHHRYGTLWSERFNSIMVEPKHRVIEAMAAYIDLNCVRAGFQDDPKDYRFCGYAEAVAGSEKARQGLQSIIEGKDWSEVQAAYRQMIFGTGAGSREQAGRISDEALKEVVEAGGKIPTSVILRCKLKYFTSGAVLGGKAFVSEQLMKYQTLTGRRKLSAPCPVSSPSEWDELTALRPYRR